VYSGVVAAAFIANPAKLLHLGESHSKRTTARRRASIYRLPGWKQAADISNPQHSGATGSPMAKMGTEEHFLRAGDTQFSFRLSALNPPWDATSSRMMRMKSDGPVSSFSPMGSGAPNFVPIQGIVGRVIHIDGKPATIVGVLPRNTSCPLALRAGLGAHPSDR
jgi:hypothetical protein